MNAYVDCCESKTETSLREGYFGTLTVNLPSTINPQTRYCASIFYYDWYMIPAIYWENIFVNQPEVSEVPGYHTELTYILSARFPLPVTSKATSRWKRQKMSTDNGVSREQSGVHWFAINR